MTMTVRVDTSALSAAIAEAENGMVEATRPAAQAGIQVIYDQVKANVARIRKVTGNLDKSIYQAFRDKKSDATRAVYGVSWNSKTGQHGHLVEFGHIQRYEYYKGSDGQVRPMVRPGMDGTPRPGRRASQAAKDAYYVPRVGGPLQVPAQPFLRPAMAESVYSRARQAAAREFLDRMRK